MTRRVAADVTSSHTERRRAIGPTASSFSARNRSVNNPASVLVELVTVLILHQRVVADVKCIEGSPDPLPPKLLCHLHCK